MDTYFEDNVGKVSERREAREAAVSDDGDFRIFDDGLCLCVGGGRDNFVYGLLGILSGAEASYPSQSREDVCDVAAMDAQVCHSARDSVGYV